MAEIEGLAWRWRLYRGNEIGIIRPAEENWLRDTGVGHLADYSDIMAAYSGVIGNTWEIYPGILCI